MRIFISYDGKLEVQNVASIEAITFEDDHMEIMDIFGRNETYKYTDLQSVIIVK